jgi:NAD(P)-dependent dehydrogenase (short-subunit alcohol dehydrogenase family)
MQTILVTGASSGFGRLITLELARRGHQVFAGVREPEGRNADAARSLRAASANVRVVALDVTREEDAAGAVESVLGATGSLDVLVNNAGVACAGLIETFTSAEAQRLFDVNVFGVLRMVRAALPSMRARGRGLLVHVSSTLGREVLPFLGLYTASKFALEGLAESLRYEVAPLGIETTILQPGTFPTTSILQHLVAPGDATRAEGYGPVAPLPAGLFAGIEAMVRDGHAPDPQRVADAVADAVDAPAGKRPPRVVIDPNGGGGAARLNAASAEVQEQLLAHLGLAWLDGRVAR